MDEIARLQETVEASVQSDEHRQEVFEMGKSYADVLIERGRKEGQITARKETLLRLLHKRFGELPEGVVSVVEAAQDVEQLDRWLERFATAEALEEVGIVPVV